MSASGHDLIRPRATIASSPLHLGKQTSIAAAGRSVQCQRVAGTGEATYFSLMFIRTNASTPKPTHIKHAMVRGFRNMPVVAHIAQIQKS